MSTPPTVGVEEEFLLADPSSYHPVPKAAEVLDRVRAPLPPGVLVQRELRATQLEVTTGVCRDAGDLWHHLTSGRGALAEAAEAAGVLAVPTGYPPEGPADAGAGGASRFARIDELYRGVVEDYQACGCHVHVGVPDRNTAVAVVNQLRPWLPTLLALSVNSPFASGRDTGYGSWRMVQQSRFPGSGIPPWFPDAPSYDTEVASLVECGTLVDDRMTFWLARPSPTMPTVELRVADTATTASEALLYAVLTRALVSTALRAVVEDREADVVGTQTAAAAVWSAARYGMAGPAVHPVRGKQLPAAARLDELLAHVRPALGDAGDLDTATNLLDAVHHGGTGAARQHAQAAKAGGLPAVVRALALRSAQA